MEQPRVGVIIVAGGSGKRMGGALPKQFSFVGGEPILARTINAFRKALPSSRIVVVLPVEYIDFWKNLSARFEVAKHSVVEGGEERFHSVRNGIESLSDAVDLIAVQDGVRPFATPELINRASLHSTMSMLRGCSPIRILPISQSRNMAICAVR